MCARRLTAQVTNWNGRWQPLRMTSFSTFGVPSLQEVETATARRKLACTESSPIENQLPERFDSCAFALASRNPGLEPISRLKRWRKRVGASCAQDDKAFTNAL